MKRKIARVKICIVFAVLVLLGLGVNMASSQVIEKKKSNIVSVDPIEILLPVANIAYEKVLNPYLSVEGKITLASEKRSGWEYTLFEVRGIVKKYTQSTAPLKFWYGGGVGIAPISALYTYFDWSEWRTKTEKGAGIFFVLSGNAGYKWLLGENFTIELGLGIAYYGGNIIIAGENIPLGGLIPDGRFSLGYTF